jgi:hypothetical protein
MIPINNGELDAQPPTARLPRMTRITDLTVTIPGSKIQPSTNTRPLPPVRWRTPEFMFYWVAFAIVVPLLIYWPIRLSSSKLHLYGKWRGS